MLAHEQRQGQQCTKLIISGSNQVEVMQSNPDDTQNVHKSQINRRKIYNFDQVFPPDQQ